MQASHLLGNEREWNILSPFSFWIFFLMNSGDEYMRAEIDLATHYSEPQTYRVLDKVCWKWRPKAIGSGIVGDNEHKYT